MKPLTELTEGEINQEILQALERHDGETIDILKAELETRKRIKEVDTEIFC